MMGAIYIRCKVEGTALPVWVVLQRLRRRWDRSSRVSRSVEQELVGPHFVSVGEVDLSVRGLLLVIGHFRICKVFASRWRRASGSPE